MLLLPAALRVLARRFVAACRRRIAPRRPLFILLLLLGSAASEGAPSISPVLVRAEEGAQLYRYGYQRVLVVRGTPREMGLAHGRLLRQEVRENTRAFLEEWALGRLGRTREELRAIWEQLRPHIPAHYLEEMAGLAEGSGVPLADLELLHSLPSRYHCTGTAVLPAVTRNGKVYHTRSLDYALDIGDRVRPQTNSILLVSVPTVEGAIAHAVVSWAGFLGCVTGMNAEGVSVGEMGSGSKDESYDGVPMIFQLRETLRLARSVKEAKELWRKGSRTCGYNFIFCDPREICAVEVNRSLIRFFAPGDPAEDVPPHHSLPGIVRRCNHFVDPALAATQRDVYDPRVSASSSWQAYELQGRLLAEASGRIDEETMIEVLRSYPASHSCLHQAVLCPTDRTLWVSEAADPAVDPLAGAQNQQFLKYDLRALVAGRFDPAAVSGTDRSVRESDAETQAGRIPRALELEIGGVFAHEPQEFAYELRPLTRMGEVSIGALIYPSPGPSRYEENLTVHAEYYRPAGKGPFPCVVVLHILDGRFYVARLLASTLSQKGIAALFIKLPYYGERRPRTPIDPKSLDLPDVVDAVRQGVRDIRRGAAWLRSRPEIDPARVGIIGVSLGAFVAELAAGSDGGFDRCAFVLGGGSIVDALYSGSKDTRKLEALLKERGFDRERVAAAFAPIEPGAPANRAGIRREGTLMINCRADEVVPRAGTESYWEAIGRPAIVWYDGGHYALKDHLFEVLGKITEHFSR